MTFKDCPDQTIIRLLNRSSAPQTLTELVSVLQHMGYYDATIKEVRRRKRELRWKGLLSPQLVSPTAKGEIDPDALN